MVASPRLVAILLLAGFTLANQVWGFFLAGGRARAKVWLERWLQRKLLGHDY
jgi:hypothetical protein